MGAGGGEDFGIDVGSSASGTFGRIEAACAFACEHCGVGFEGHPSRGTLENQLHRIVRELAPERHHLLVAPSPQLAGAKGIVERALEVDRLVQERASRPEDELYVACLAARAAARARITHREPDIDGRGNLVWVPSGSVRALVLFALSRVRAIASRVFPSHATGRAAARSTTPFRSPPPRVDPRPDAPVEPTRAHRHLERALILTAMLDAWNYQQRSDELNPFAAGASLTDDDFATARRRVIDELESARVVFACDSTQDPPQTCAALALEVISHVRAIRPDALESTTRRAEGALTDFTTAVASWSGLEGSPRSLVSHAASRGGNVTATESMFTLIDALAASFQATDAPPLPTSDWEWCDEYFLVSLAGRRASPVIAWVENLLRPGAIGSKEKRRWRALHDHVRGSTRPPLTDDDHAKAMHVRSVLERFAVAGPYFAVPSLRSMLDKLRLTADGDRGLGKPEDQVAGLQEALTVLHEWTKVVRFGFTWLRPHGQVLERHIQTTLFGSCAEWPVPPSFSDPF